MKDNLQGETIRAKILDNSTLYWKDFKGYSVGSLATDLMLPKTIQITGCEKIILRDKSLDFVFELSRGKIEDFDQIVINGITFKRCDTNVE